MDTKKPNTFNITNFMVMATALVCLLALFVFLNITYSNINDLYRHPFTVSNSVKEIETNILEIDTYLASQYNSGSKNQRADFLNNYNEVILKQFKSVEKVYLGDKHEVQLAMDRYLIWRSTVDFLLANNIPKKELDGHRNQYFHELSDLRRSIDNIHRYAISKAKSFHDSSRNYFILTLISIFLVIFITAYYFHRFYRKYIKKFYRSNRLLEKSRNLYRHILTSSPDALVICNSDSIIIDINSQAEILFGYGESELLGMNVDNLIPHKYRKQHKVNIRNFIGGPARPVESILMGGRFVKALTKDGEELDVAITLSSTEIDNELYILTSIRDVSSQVEDQRTIYKQAYYDPLTGLPNRTLAEEKFNAISAIAKRKNSNVALLFIDLDDFKKINDNLGHEIGDKLLRVIGYRLSKCLRESDVLARLGGDEFVAILSDIGSEMEAERKAEDLIESANRDILVEARNLRVGASIGIVMFPTNGDSYSELLRKADAAMYTAKAMGTNQKCLFVDSISLEASRRFQIESALLTALDNNEFYVMYHPQINLSDGEVIGVEALLRWKNAELGVISPDEFIPIAENNGAIIEIGNFVIDKSFEFMAKIKPTVNSEKFRISINISPRQLLNTDLRHVIDEAITRHHIAHDDVTVEITETVLLEHSKDSLEALTYFSNEGIHISMDDFGTGYSSISYLKKYHFDHIKLDRSFVQEVDQDAATKNLLESAIAMAHALNIEVVAEGLETEEHVHILKQLNCDYAQGFFFSKPLTETEFINYIRPDNNVYLLNDKAAE